MKTMLIFVLLMISLLCPITSSGYLPTLTHPLINEYALYKSNADDYLKNQLGFINGVKEAVNDKKVFEWIRKGGTDEDANIRGLFHFHDPTKSWAYAGILSLGFSSLDWAQNNTVGPVLTCSDITPLDIPCTELPPGSNPTWSWPAVRAYYYDALTSGDATIRGEKFGKTFLALGHVMHLLADAAVPEHSRNDQHMLFPRGSRYEEWAENTGVATGLLTSFIEQNSGMVDYSVITSISNVSGYIPISNFWDTTPNPGYGGTLLGLAEYTNYNFLSPGTIFTNYTYPINPQLSSGTLEVVQGEDGIPDTKVYFSGVTSDSRPIQHFVSTGYLWADLQSVSPFSMDSAKFVLDETCYKDYASILVPKAVAYDTGLLNYFFRGQIDMISDPTNSANYVITNLSNEDMTGDFGLYYDDTNDNRYLISTWNLSVSANSQSVPVTFTAPTSPSPKENGKYMLVFKGIQGNENDAVAGEAVSLKKTISASGSISIDTSAWIAEMDIVEKVSCACGCEGPGHWWPDLITMAPASFWNFMDPASGSWWSTFDEGIPVILERDDVTYATRMKTVSIYDEPSTFDPASYGCSSDSGIYCDVSLYGLTGAQNHSLSAMLNLYEDTSSQSVEFIGKQSGVHVLLTDRSEHTDAWGNSYILFKTPTQWQPRMDPNAPASYGWWMNLDSRLYPLLLNEDIIVKIGDAEYDTSDPAVKKALLFSWQVY